VKATLVLVGNMGRARMLDAMWRWPLLNARCGTWEIRLDSTAAKTGQHNRTTSIASNPKDLKKNVT
jgi:hypothetical protein